MLLHINARRATHCGSLQRWCLLIVSPARERILHHREMTIIDINIGALDGASFINEKFQAKILQKLANEQYLIGNGKTLKSIAQAKTTVFENYQKRIIDVTTKKPTKPVTVYIDNLRESKNKKLLTNNIPLKW